MKSYITETMWKGKGGRIPQFGIRKRTEMNISQGNVQMETKDSMYEFGIYNDLWEHVLIERKKKKTESH